MVVQNIFSSISLSSYRGYFYNLLGINDNIIMITILNILCAMLITYLYSFTSDYKFSNVIDYFRESCIRSNSIELEGDIFKKGKWESYTDFSEKTKGILYYISTLEIGDTTNYNISHIKEIVHSYNRYVDVNEEDETQRFTQYIVHQGSTFKLDSEIYCKVTTKSTLTEPEKKNDEKINYKIKITSKKHSLKYLIAFIDNCEKQYKQYLKKKNNNQYFMTIKDASKKKLIWNNFIFKSNRNFDNMYISNKDEILSRINFFINNKDYYVKKGLPYTLGLLFYGDPGTGKTSFIKALANLLGRHLLEVPLKKICSCEALYEAFYTKDINGISLSFENKIIVLEDIDAMDDLIKNRIETTKKIMKNTVDTEIEEDSGDDEGGPVNLNHIFTSLINKNNKKTIKDISLSFLLNLMEGILEMDGRIIIMTTNHIDKIDPALIRPGRIDDKICFKKLHKNEINNMIRFYISEWKDMELTKNFTVSHAELMNIIIKARDDVEQIKETILKLDLLDLDMKYT